MEAQVITALANFGGLGVLSIVLFYLHIKNNDQRDKDRGARRDEFKAMLDTFKQEQKFEREMCDKHFSILADAVSKNQTALIEQTHLMAEQHDLLKACQK